METIFIQIASYRDPELNRTIESCLKNAAYPERISFGVCDQYERVTDMFPVPQARIHSVYWKGAKGVGWARNICNGLYRDEDFTLQIDSHHRFEKGWDEKLIQQWKDCKHPKAVITGYPPGYEYNERGEEVLHHMPQYTMIVKGFDMGYIPTFRSSHIPRTHNRPYRGSFIAAGFMFTIGKVCNEVPYSEAVYFTGEEITHSLRLFTHGYRVYYPSKWFIWHLYERKGAERHWENFLKDENLTSKYREIEKISFDYVRGVLSGDPKFKSELGSINSLEDFENYSGVCFKYCLAHKKQLEGFEPPFEFTSDWVNGEYAMELS